MDNLNNLKMSPATVPDMVALAAYYRQCARDEYNGFSTLNAAGHSSKVSLEYGTHQMKYYLSRALYWEGLAEKDMVLRAERLKEIHRVSQQGKTFELFNDEQMSGKSINEPAIPMGPTKVSTVVEKKEKVTIKLEKKTNDPNKETFTTLAELSLKEEDKALIAKEWKETKGDKGKKALYEKVRDLLNNYDLSISELRSVIGSFVHAYGVRVANENGHDILARIEKAKITFKLDKIKLSKLMSGKDLLSGSHSYSINDDFNLSLLTGHKSIEDAPPADVVKLRAIYLRVSGRESKAIKEIKDFFSTEDWKWDNETAFLFLNAITKEIKHTPIKQLVKNILVHKATKENILEGVSNVTKLLHAYTVHDADVKVKDKDGALVPKQVKKSWGEGKITNFVNECLSELFEAKLLVKPEVKKSEVKKPVDKKPVKKTKEEAPNVDSKTSKDVKKEPAKKAEGNKTEKKKPAVKVVGKVDLDKVDKPKKEKPKAATPSKKDNKVQANNKADNRVGNKKKVEGKGADKTANKPVTKVESKEPVKPVSKEEAKTVATPTANLKGTQAKKSEEEKQKLKAAKLAAKEAEKENGKTKMETVVKTTADVPPSSIPEDKVEIINSKFQGVIYKNSKSGKYGCYVKGYKDHIHVKNIIDIKKVKSVFNTQLQAYIKKVERINKKSQNGSNIKGKLYQMLPDNFTMSNIQLHNIGTVEAV
jgi:hypothetical protein